LTISVVDPERKPYQWDGRGKLGAIKEPTLVLVGPYDFICPPKWAREIHAEIAGSELVEFPDSGHFAHLEQPEQFDKAVRDFAARLPEAP
jgi:pimeloyl-ACP methyl ester carboxylesterase